MMLHRLASLVLNQPHYITPEAAGAILDVLAGRIGVEVTSVPTPEASRFRGEPQLDEKVGSAGYRLTATGTAILPIIGELTNRGAYVGASSGLVSYEGLRYTLQHAADNGRVRSILLDIASPGGMASGMAETADLVRAIASKKPVVAVANDMAASAAYGIASQARKLYVTQAGYVGSIGVVLMHADQSAMLEKKGVKVTFIHAGAHKVDGNPYQPLPKEVAGRLQAQVAKHYDAFVALVAKGRPTLSADAIKGTEAQIFMGQDAVDAGLADGVRSFEDVLAELDGRLVPRIETKVTVNVNAKGPEMTEKTEQKQDDAEAKINAIAAQVGKAKDLGVKEGQEQAKARIRAILGHKSAEGRKEMAEHLAFSTDMPADAAIALLEKAPKKSAIADPIQGAGVTPSPVSQDTSDFAKGRAIGERYKSYVLGKTASAAA